MNKYEIADKIGISHQAVYNWYNGKSLPSLKNMVKLSEILNISIEEILKQFKH